MATDNSLDRTYSEGGSNTLHRLLADYVDRLNAGEMLDVDKIASEHGQCANELLKSLEAFQAFGRQPAPESVLGTLGDYTLRRQIGRGGMGVVYEAWENAMERVVALKVLPTGVAVDDRAFRRFMQEAKTAGKLSHQNIVSVHAMGVYENTPYFSMEYVEGETLAEVLCEIKNSESETETPFGAKDSIVYFGKVAEAFASVADGLQHAHQKGVVHRDIKPSNLILDVDGRLRILDFGLARLEGQESLTLSGDLLGTPLYMSPEQARHQRIPIDHRTDVYSIGATLYEAICDRPPFRGRNHADTLSQIIERDPLEPRRVNAHVPKDLETIVLKCLRKHSNDRYGTAEALGQDLHRFVVGQPIEARPPGRWEGFLSKLKREQVRIVVLVCFVLCGLLGGFLVLRHLEDVQQERNTQYEKAIKSAVTKIELGRSTKNWLRSSTTESLPGPWGFLNRHPVVTVDYESDDNSWATTIDEALAELHQTQDLRLKREGIHYHIARALLVLGRRDEAREALGRIPEDDPFYLPSTLLASEISSESAESDEGTYPEPGDISAPWLEAWTEAFRAVKVNDWERADEAYSRLLASLDPEATQRPGLYLEARLGRGWTRLMAKELDGAVEDFVAARERWPELDEPALLLGMTYWERGSKEIARKTFEARHAVSPAPSALASKIAGVFRDLREWNEGLRWATQIKEVAPSKRHSAYFLKRLRRLDDALCAIDAAIDADPKHPGSYFERGQILAAGGDDEGALRSYDTALKLQPSMRRALRRRAVLRAEKGDMEGSLVDTAAVFEASPMDREMLFLRHQRLADIWSRAERFETVVANHEALFRLEPRHGCNHFELARAFTRRGDDERALGEYSRALELAAETECFQAIHALTYSWRGVSWSRRGDSERAFADWDKATRLDPEMVEPFENRGLEFLKTGDTMRAITEFTAAIELAPKRAMAYRSRGYARRKLGEPVSALADLNRAIELDASNSRAFYFRGSIKAAGGDFDEAVADFQRTIELEPSNVAAYLERGVIYATRQDSAAAERDFSKAIELAPDFSRTYFHRGELRASRGDHEGALEDLNRAVELAPEYLDACWARARERARGGQLKEALREGEQLLGKRKQPDVEALFEWARVLSVAARYGDDPSLKDRAVATLRQTIEAGYRDFERIRSCADFNAIRGRVDFLALFEGEGNRSGAKD